MEMDSDDDNKLYDCPCRNHHKHQLELEQQRIQSIEELA